MFPLDVNAGVHPHQLRRDHEGIRMMGGVDKVGLTQGKEAIKQELARLKPLVKEGGFSPTAITAYRLMWHFKTICIAWRLNETFSKS